MSVTTTVHITSMD